MSMTICEVLLPSAHFNGESTLPSLYEMSNVQGLTRSALDEDDELFVGYGFLPSIFPYRMQDDFCEVPAGSFRNSGFPYRARQGYCFPAHSGFGG